MNAFKSPVLNRQCLGNKIEELSPLLLNHLNLGISNTLFQATWSYYASGCQERLTSIRRRIEQNAKIVVPTRTQLHNNLNLGVDLEDRIYHEFVSCFRSSDESPGKAKNPPKRSTIQKELNAVQYPTPKQWNSWKREEREVRQMLMQSFDPYRAEELTSKLQKLRKLISRRPLIVLPFEPEEPKEIASKKTKRRSSIKTQKQPEFIPRPGPYVNRPSRVPLKTAKPSSEAGILRKLSTKDTSQDSKSSLTNPEIKHSSPETTSNMSKRSDRDALGLNFKIVSLPEGPENHFEAKLSDNEGPKKLKSYRTSLRKKSSKISQVSKLRKNNSPAKVKNKKDKLKKHDLSIDSEFFLPQNDQQEKKNPDIPIDLLFFHPQKEQEVSKESQSSRSTLKYKFSEISYSSKNSLNKSAGKLNKNNLLKKPQNPKENPVLENYLKKSMENYDKEKPRELSNQRPDEKPALLEDFVTENMENLNVEKLGKPFIQTPEEKPGLLKDSGNKISKNPHVEEQGKKSEILQIIPDYKPNKFNRNAHFWHLSGKAKTYIPFKFKRNMRKPFSRDFNIKAKDGVGQRSILRKEHSQNPTETYIPFKANRDGIKPATAPLPLPLFLDQEKATKTETNPESRAQYDWPLPVGLKHIEYFKPYGQLTGEQANQVQTFPEIPREKRKSSIFVPTEIRLSLGKRKLSNLTPPEIRIPFLDSHFNWNGKSENRSSSYEKTTLSSPVSSEDLKQPPPVIISDVILECLKTYGSDISFKNTFTNFMKPNKLDCYPEIPITEAQPKMDKAQKIKPKKKKFSKKVLTQPSRREPPPCSLCNLVRRRQSELRPYMKRMQRQRQRLELKTYYTQKILKDRRCQEARKAHTREVLTRCYQTLNFCQELLELRLLQRSPKGEA